MSVFRSPVHICCIRVTQNCSGWSMLVTMKIKRTKCVIARNMTQARLPRRHTLFDVYEVLVFMTCDLWWIFQDPDGGCGRFTTQYCPAGLATWLETKCRWKETSHIHWLVLRMPWFLHFHTFYDPIVLCNPLL